VKAILTSDTHYGMDGKTHAKHDRFWRKVQDEIVSNDVKVLLWAGDLACNKQSQLARTIRHAREYVSIPILLVRGNHDFWDAPSNKDEFSGRRSFQLLDAFHRDLFAQHGIHHLENNPKVIDDVLFCGWDGWYATPPLTNDADNMFRDVNGSPMHAFMSNRAWKAFEAVMDLDVEPYRAAVAVTHFNPYVVDRKWEAMCANLRFYDMVKEKFDVFCCGHNHQKKDRIEDGCKVLNSGSQYNNPQFLTFEV
jgi:predicted phosphodiesterase